MYIGSEQHYIRMLPTGWYCLYRRKNSVFLSLSDLFEGVIIGLIHYLKIFQLFHISRIGH